MADLDIDALIAAQAPQFFDPFDPRTIRRRLFCAACPAKKAGPGACWAVRSTMQRTAGHLSRPDRLRLRPDIRILIPRWRRACSAWSTPATARCPASDPVSLLRRAGRTLPSLSRRRGAPANPPGHSLHERGDAADVNMRGNQGRDGGAAFITNNAASFGLRQPYRREPWHVEVDPSWQGLMPSVATGREAVASAAPQQRQGNCDVGAGSRRWRVIRSVAGAGLCASTSQGKSMDEDLITGSVPPTSSPLSGLLGGLFTGGSGAKTIGGLGGLGGMPDQSSAGGGWRDMLRAMSMALMSSPGNAPFQNLPTVYNAMLQERARADDRRYNREKDRRDFDFRKAEADQAQSNANRQFTLAQQQAKPPRAAELAADQRPGRQRDWHVQSADRRDEADRIGQSRAPPASKLRRPRCRPCSLWIPRKVSRRLRQLDLRRLPQSRRSRSVRNSKVGPNGMPIIPGVRTLVSKEDRRAFGIPDEDTRVYQVDGAGKVTSAGGQNININSGEKSYDLDDQQVICRSPH